MAIPEKRKLKPDYSPFEYQKAFGESLEEYARYRKHTKMWVAADIKKKCASLTNEKVA